MVRFLTEKEKLFLSNDGIWKFSNSQYDYFKRNIVKKFIVLREDITIITKSLNKDNSAIPLNIEKELKELQKLLNTNLK